MDKRLQSQIEKYNSKDKVKFSLFTLSLVVFCSFLIVIATFTQLSFFHYVLPLDAFLHPIKFISENQGAAIPIKYYQYIPQIPIIMYIAALLGPRFGFMSTIIYIALGLTIFPIFALGGGVSYLMQYNFGYILAYLPAVIIVNKYLNKNFSYTSIAKSSVLGVLTIHIIGVIYIILISMIKKDPISYAFTWAIIQTFSKIIYDFIFSFIAVVFAKASKKALWFVLG